MGKHNRFFLFWTYSPISAPDTTTKERETGCVMHPPIVRGQAQIWSCFTNAQILVNYLIQFTSQCVIFMLPFFIQEDRTFPACAMTKPQLIYLLIVLYFYISLNFLCFIFLREAVGNVNFLDNIVGLFLLKARQRQIFLL